MPYSLAEESWKLKLLRVNNEIWKGGDNLWSWKYDVGQKVRLNDNCKWAYPNMKNKIGIVSELHTGKLYDYDVMLDGDIWTVRVKENEIDLLED